MPDIERTVTVNTPIDVVWPYLKDFTNTEEWDPPTLRTTRTSGDGGVGTTYHNVSKLLGSEAEVDYEVVECVERQRLQLKGRSGKTELLDTITFTSTPTGGTSVTYRAEFHPHGAGKLATPLLPPALKVLGDKVSSRLEEKLQELPR